MQKFTYLYVHVRFKRAYFIKIDLRVGSKSRKSLKAFIKIRPRFEISNLEFRLIGGAIQRYKVEKLNLKKNVIEIFYVGLLQ